MITVTSVEAPNRSAELIDRAARDGLLPVPLRTQRRLASHKAGTDPLRRLRSHRNAGPKQTKAVSKSLHAMNTLPISGSASREPSRLD
jgi:hypothetical protein